MLEIFAETHVLFWIDICTEEKEKNAVHQFAVEFIFVRNPDENIVHNSDVSRFTYETPFNTHILSILQKEKLLAFLFFCEPSQ